MKGARKAIEKLQKAFEAAAAGRTATLEALRERIQAERGCMEADVDHASAAKAAETTAASLRTLKAILSAAEKERARTEKALDKAQERTAGAHDQVAAAMG